MLLLVAVSEEVVAVFEEDIIGQVIQIVSLVTAYRQLAGKAGIWRHQLTAECKRRCIFLFVCIGTVAHIAERNGGINKTVAYIVFAVKGAKALCGVAVLVIHIAGLQPLRHSRQIGLVQVAVNVLGALCCCAAGNTEQIGGEHLDIYGVGIVAYGQNNDAGIVYVFQRTQKALVICHLVGIERGVFLDEQIIAQHEGARAAVQAAAHTGA